MVKLARVIGIKQACLGLLMTVELAPVSRMERAFARILFFIVLLAHEANLPID
jgi:hypothetical protein